MVPVVAQWVGADALSFQIAWMGMDWLEQKKQEQDSPFTRKAMENKRCQVDEKQKEKLDDEGKIAHQQ